MRELRVDRRPAEERSLRDEAAWLPDSIDDLADIIAMADRHFPRPAMAGMTDWLIRKTMGWPDPTSSATRAKYRKMLRALQYDLDVVGDVTDIGVGREVMPVRASRRPDDIKLRSAEQPGTTIAQLVRAAVLGVHVQANDAGA